MKRKSSIYILFLFLIIICFTGCSTRGNAPKDGSVNSTVDSSESSNNTESMDDSVMTELNNMGHDEADNKNQTSEDEKNNTKDSNMRNDSTIDSVTIVFVDDKGNVIKTEEVEKGEDATPPDDPEKDGYKFEGWNYDYNDVQTDLTITPFFKEITEPTLVVKNVSANKANDKVDVAVSVYNNPGFLSMVINIQYDESVLTLTDVTNGSLMGDYVFTPPKNMKSDCNAAWNINDIPEGSEEGEVMVLHFQLSNNAKTGKYPISVSCLSNAFNDSYEAFSFESLSGSITIN